ncbi:MAG: FAD-dependent oxidoreductase [Capsulimonadaceae bacterium]|nr:FAD-dependent oxidoreductase [Capsulimonadaceae bacterium]
MKTYDLPSRSISLDDSYDVIVVGGGPAGATAAAASARDGARTLLIESTGCLGGMGTSALVPAWCPFSDKEKVIYKGLAEWVFTQLKAKMPHVPSRQLDWVPIDAEKLKVVYDDLVTQYGAKVLFNTLLASVETDGHGKVETLIVANKSGLRAFKAPVIVDCTGDADVAAWAGAKFHLGDDTPEANLMPATHCFVLGNVDEYAYNTGPNLHAANPNSPIFKIIASGKYPRIPDAHLCSNIVAPRTVGFNAGHLWNVDNTKPETISQALIDGRKMAEEYRDALAEFYPSAFANAFVAQTGALMGIRETRRIVGDYTITMEDYAARRAFDDEICRNSYFIDVHPGVKKAFKDMSEFKSWEGTTIHYGPGESHGIPYRTLAPQGLSNVLVAGRSISCEQIVQGSVRVMPVCLSMGEAAGAAAAQAVAAAKAGATIDVHALDVAKLRTRLRAADVYLP